MSDPAAKRAKTAGATTPSGSTTDETAGGTGNGTAETTPLSLLNRTPAVSSAFDGGNIKVVSVSNKDAGTDPQATGTCTFTLEITPEQFTATDQKQHFQWFHFRASNVNGKKCVFEITNAGKASYPGGWNNYAPMCSTDYKTWTRVPLAQCSYKEGVLSWQLDTPVDGPSSVWFSYFTPYTYLQHQQLVARSGLSRFARLVSLGSTLDGRSIDLLIIHKDVDAFCKDPQACKLPKFWTAGRQHPGESMAEWCVEGLLDRLLDEDDATAKRLRAQSVFFVVPNMNPDGSFRGHLRTNACGANLNREWTSKGDYIAPSLERSPEVYHVLRALDAFGCDGYVDVHGDEAIEGNFLAQESGCPNWTPLLKTRYDTFLNNLLRANPDFQTDKNYPADEPGKANLAICAAQITVRFNCFATTLEMPFKDTADEFPQHKTGWSARRSTLLGASLLDAWSSLL